MDLQEFVKLIETRARRVAELIKEEVVETTSTSEFVQVNLQLYNAISKLGNSFNLPQSHPLLVAANRMLNDTSSMCEYIRQGKSDMYRQSLLHVLQEVRKTCIELSKKPTLVQAQAETIGSSQSISLIDPNLKETTESKKSPTESKKSLNTPISREVPFASPSVTPALPWESVEVAQNPFPELANYAPSKTQGYKAEFGRDNVTQEQSFALTDSQEDHTWYKDYFVGNSHRILIGNANQSVAVIVFLLPEYTNSVKAMIFSKTGTKRYIIPPEHCTDVKAAQQWITKESGVTQVYITPFPTIETKLVEFEEKNIFKRYKFGVLYVRDGQVEENDMFSNCDPSPDFQEFLDFIGQTIKLQGWSQYRGGLDVKANTTGEKSVYVTHRGIEVMFHISTMLPFQPADAQRVERKRHLGNDVVSIVFKEGNTPFDPLCLTNQFNNIFCIIQKDPSSTESKTFYRLSFINKVGVPTYPPFLKAHPVYEKNSHFKDLLLTKLINGERAAMKGPDFKLKNLRTRALMLDNIYNEFLPLAKITAETKFRGKSGPEIQRAFDEDDRHFLYEGTLNKNKREYNCCLLSSYLVAVEAVKSGSNLQSAPSGQPKDYKILFSIDLRNSQLVSTASTLQTTSIHLRESCPTNSYPYVEVIDYAFETLDSNWLDYIHGVISTLHNDAFVPALKEKDYAIFQASATRKTYQKGHILIKQGQHFESLYIIESGQCDVVVNFKVIASAEQRTILGERGFLGEKANASVVVSSPEAVVLSLEKSVVYSLLKLDAQFSRSFFCFVANTVAFNKYHTTVRQGLQIANKQLSQGRAKKLQQAAPSNGPDLRKSGSSQEVPALSQQHKKLMEQLKVKDQAVLKTLPAHIHVTGMKCNGFFALFSQSMGFSGKTFGIKMAILIDIKKIKSTWLEKGSSEAHLLIETPEQKKPFKFGFFDKEAAEKMYEVYLNLNPETGKDRRMTLMSEDVDMSDLIVSSNNIMQLTSDDWKRILACGILKKFAPNETIIQKDTVIFAFTFLATGTARVAYETLNKEKKTEALQPGQVLGEISFMYPGKTLVSIEAETHVTANQIPFASLEELFQQDVPLAARFYSHVCAILIRRLERKD